MAAAALRMRQPRRAVGPVHAAVAICGAVVGIYDVVIGIHYLQGSVYDLFLLSFGVRYIAGYTAFVSSLSEVVLVFGVFQREEKDIYNRVSTVLALFTFCASLPLIIIIMLACSEQWITLFWEIPRMLLYPLHFCLMVSLLAELRGELADASAIGGGLNKSKAAEGRHFNADEEKGDSNGVAEAHQPPVSSNLC
ncbi:hypothetical protein R5R35_005568 [Gryllus longicercus]|uniref:Uncharacterized protein n=1 Tax=Gryllus longicercus TaxID=2509291 RepID=A0AAN9W324_9ORTH